MSYYEASRVVDRLGIKTDGLPREKLYESPWIEGPVEKPNNCPRLLSHQAAARNALHQRERIFEANWILWERVRSYPSRTRFRC